MSDDESDPAEFDIRMIEVGAQPLRVAVKRGPKGSTAVPAVQRHRRQPRIGEAVHARVEAHGSDHLRRARRWRIPAPALALSALVNCASGRAALDATGTSAGRYRRRFLGRRDGAAVRPSALRYVPKARAGGDVAGRDHGARQSAACCGRWRRRDGTSTRASCGASLRRFTAAPSAKTRSSSTPTPGPWLERAAADTFTRCWR